MRKRGEPFYSQRGDRGIVSTTGTALRLLSLVVGAILGNAWVITKNNCQSRQCPDDHSDFALLSLLGMAPTAGGGVHLYNMCFIFLFQTSKGGMGGGRETEASTSLGKGTVPGTGARMCMLVLLRKPIKVSQSV